jgi:hypothetical protein
MGRLSGLCLAAPSWAVAAAELVTCEQAFAGTIANACADFCADVLLPQRNTVASPSSERSHHVR